VPFLRSWRELGKLEELGEFKGKGFGIGMKGERDKTG
jgi:hypothetical protein